MRKINFNIGVKNGKYIYKNKIHKNMAQHQNVFLTALSCQGTFITF